MTKKITNIEITNYNFTLYKVLKIEIEEFKNMLMNFF
jgi:hypothetical protein